MLDLQTQLRNLIEENKVMQEKYKSMFDKMQQELRKKQLYIEDLKNKVRFHLICNMATFINFHILGIG